MAHLNKGILAATAALLLTSCSMSPKDFATAPRLPDDYGVNVASVLFSVECEIRETIADIRRHPVTPSNRLSFLNQWKARANFILEVENVIKPNGTAVLIVPYTNGALTASLGSGLEKKERLKTEVVVEFDLQEKIDQKCFTTPYAQDSDDSDLPVYRIGGVVGLRDWFETINVSLSAIDANPFGLTYTAAFDLISTGTAGAVFAPVPSTTDNRLGGNIGLSGSHTEKNTVTISSVPLETKKGKPKDPAKIDNDLNSLMLMERLGDRRGY